MTVDYIRTPTKLLDGFQYTTGIKNSTFAVIFIFLTLFVGSHQTVLEIIIIIDKIDLTARSLNRSYFNNQGMISIIYDDVHSR